MSEQLRRFQIGILRSSDGPMLWSDLDADGEWCLHEDAAAELTRLRSENQALREEVERLKREKDEARQDFQLYRKGLNAIAWTQYDNVAFAKEVARDILAIGVPVAKTRGGEAASDALATQITTLTTRAERAEADVRLIATARVGEMDNKDVQRWREALNRWAPANPSPDGANHE